MAIKILFLAANLQPFLASGICELYQHYDVSVLLYCAKGDNNNFHTMPVDKGFQQYEYDGAPDSNFSEMATDFNPDIVFCAGWMFPIYLKWCSDFRKRGVKTICAMDTQWKATLKQKLHVLFAPLYLRKSFSHAWVPGQRQYDYAIRLGFKPENILPNLYAPNSKIFADAFCQFKLKNAVTFPKKLLYVGRLEEHKLKNFLSAFHLLKGNELNDWSLTIIGDGAMKNSSLLQHRSITLVPFLPQNILVEFVAKGGVFCLCSSNEPWGTVVQEFAAAGMPLLVSKQCGSSDYFVQDNGVLCDGQSVNSIYEALLSFIKKNDKELFGMAEKSHQLGISSTSKDWAKSLLSIS